MPKHLADRAAGMGRVLAGAAALGLAVTGCSGPVEPLQMNVQAVGTNLVLGPANEAVARAPLVPGPMLALPPSGVLALPSLGSGTTGGETAPGLLPSPGAPAVTLSPCPPAPPLETPALEAGLDASKPPVPASYDFRTTGSYQLGTGKETFPPLSTWTVGAVSWGPAGGQWYDFAVAVNVGGATTTTTYRVVPEGAVPAQEGYPATTTTTAPAPPPPYVVIGSPPQPGLYVMSVQSGSSPAVDFNGQAGMLLAQFPVVQNNAFTSSATDATSTISYTSTVRRDARVNACGVPLQAWSIELSGTVAQADPSQGPDVSFATTLLIAPQYGGIPVAVRSSRSSQAPNPDSVHEVFDATIDGVPKVPR